MQNAVNSPIHHTLAAAVQAAGLVDTPMQPANRAAPTKALTYHVVPCRITGWQLSAIIRAGHGTATLATVEGKTAHVDLSAAAASHIASTGGSAATVTQANVMQWDGVIHLVDAVLTPTR